MPRYLSRFHCVRYGCRGRPPLPLALVSMLHEVRDIRARGIVRGQVGGNEEMSRVEWQRMYHHLGRSSFARCRRFRGSIGHGSILGFCILDDAIQDRVFDLEEMAAIDHQAGEVASTKLARYYGFHKRAPKLCCAASEADQVSSSMLAQTIVHSCDESTPDPCVVFGGKIRCVIWELVLRGR